MGMILDLPTDPLLRANWDAGKELVINQGGTSSGKTYAILQVLLYRLANEKATATVVGQDVPNLKRGAYRDAKNIINSSDYLRMKWGRPNESDRIFTCRDTGSIIEFLSCADEQDAKSGKRDYLFVNEANGIPFTIFDQLRLRTYKQTFIDFNPTSEFWAHLKFPMPEKDSEAAKNAKWVWIRSTHWHNKHLPQSVHDAIERLRITDPDKYLVYGEGKTGKLRSGIYQNWSVVENMPETYKWRVLGVDFGFTNDPTAIVDVRLSEGKVWVDEVSYRTEMTNEDIATTIIDGGYQRDRVICDSAEPKSIAELRVKRLHAEAAVKGADSILHGIDLLHRYTIHVTARSENIIKELQGYTWFIDKNGNQTNRPVDARNHALDALRYVALKMLERRG